MEYLFNKENMYGLMSLENGNIRVTAGHTRTNINAYG